MTTSPDTVNTAEATTAADATNANQATPVSAGTTWGTITAVSDHRRHHKYSDREGDPHSPWRYGDDWKALSKGLIFAHIGWLFDPNMTSQEKFSPDLLADRRIKTVDGWFPGLVAVSLLLPALIGGLWGMSWPGAGTAFFWGNLVRIPLLPPLPSALTS